MKANFWTGMVSSTRLYILLTWKWHHQRFFFFFFHYCVVLFFWERLFFKNDALQITLTSLSFWKEEGRSLGWVGIGFLAACCSSFWERCPKEESSSRCAILNSYVNKMGKSRTEYLWEEQSPVILEMVSSLDTVPGMALWKGSLASGICHWSLH